MNDYTLSALYHALTPQWKKDYNHQYYLRNKEKWKGYRQTSDYVRNDYKTAIENTKKMMRDASTAWKQSKRQAKADAKRGYRETTDTKFVYNPDTDWYDLVPYSKREAYSKKQYKQDAKDARRKSKQEVRNYVYEAKKNSKEYTKNLIESVKQDMQNIKMSDMSSADKRKAIKEGRRIIKEAKKGQRKLNFELTITKLKSLGLNPYA